MGCMGSSNRPVDDLLDKKKSRMTNSTGLGSTIVTEPANEDEEKMVKHRKRIQEKRKKENAHP